MCKGVPSWTWWMVAASMSILFTVLAIWLIAPNLLVTFGLITVSTQLIGILINRALVCWDRNQDRSIVEGIVARSITPSSAQRISPLPPPSAGTSVQVNTIALEMLRALGENMTQELQKIADILSNAPKTLAEVTDGSMGGVGVGVTTSNVNSYSQHIIDGKGYFSAHESRMVPYLNQVVNPSRTDPIYIQFVVGSHEFSCQLNNNRILVLIAPRVDVIQKEIPPANPISQSSVIYFILQQYISGLGFSTRDAPIGLSRNWKQTRHTAEEFLCQSYQSEGRKTLGSNELLIHRFIGVDGKVGVSKFGEFPGSCLYRWKPDVSGYQDFYLWEMSTKPQNELSVEEVIKALGLLNANSHAQPFETRGVSGPNYQGDVMETQINIDQE